MNETPARVALAWVCGRPGVTATLMGVSRAEQVNENAAALETTLSAEHLNILDSVSSPADPKMLYSLFTPSVQQKVIFGGNEVSRYAQMF